VRGAARRAHAAVFSQVGRSVVLSVPDIEVVLRGALAGTPAVAAAVPGAIRLGAGLGGVGAHPAVRAALAVMQSGLAVARLATPALLAGALLLALGVYLMPDPRDALVAAGAALIAVGVALWAVVPVGGAVVARLPHEPLARGAAAGVWTVALAGLRAWGLTLGGIGVVLAAAGSSLLERLDLAELGRRARRAFVAEPRHRSLQAARGVALTALGLLAVVAPRATLATLVVLAGLALAFVGLRELFAVVLHAAPAEARLGRAFAQSGEGWAVGGVLVVMLATAFAVVLAVTNRVRATDRAPTTIAACNGAAALCDRRLDEVAFAGTHNAMAAADVAGWMFPHQERGIATQLADGVRALLVDVHYGVPTGGRVKSDLADGAMLAHARRALGPEGTAAALRVRERLVAGDAGARGLYLCHGLCELGAVAVDTALRALHDFLVQHPDEVVLLVVEDHVAPADLARALEGAGLAELAYRGPAAGPWPTLRELIARDERLVVLIESGRPGVPWLLPAFVAAQETPFGFAAPGDTLSCAPNRGGTGGRLLLVNHWVDTPPAPRPSNAAVVNAYDRLLERARRCGRARGRAPTVLAVDFYRTGDLLRVVRTLNGLTPAAGR
jgi:hypothetical protein